MGFVLTTPPSVEPVSLAEAKSHLRIDGTDDDTLLGTLITAARRQAEGYTGAGLLSQVWTLSLDGFPTAGSFIPLPRGPVLSLDAITYLDASGAEQVVADDDLAALAVLDQTPLSANVSLVGGAVWPVTTAQKRAVSIAFTVGYATTTANTPADLKAAVLLRLADLYRNREAQMASPLVENRSVCALLDPHVRTPRA